MELPCIFAIVLAAGSPSNVTLGSATRGVDPVHVNQEVAVECTSVMLEYFTAGKSKKTHSENCSDHNRAVGDKGQSVQGGVYKHDGDSK